MTLTQLRHFVTLAEVGSFAKSANLLFITQPALSRSIQALEAEINQTLFDRIGRKIEISSIGQVLLPYAKNLLQEAHSFKSFGERVSKGLSGRVRLGLGSGPSALLSEPMMLHMVNHYPMLHFEISRGNTDLLLHSLRAGRIDAAVVDIRSLRPSPDLSISQEFEMEASFMCRAEHPILRHKGAVLFHQILNYPIACTPLSDEVARILTDCFGSSANPEEMVTLTCDDTQTLVEVARNSDAIVLAINAVRGTLITLKTKPSLKATARFGMITLRHRSEIPGMAIVRDLVSQIFRPLAITNSARR
jgi:DNA-binding transcriptional LysR family regulator